jgi:hypothetical protein
MPRPPETKAQKIGIALHAKAETFIQTDHIDYSSATPEEQEAARLLPAILDYLPKGRRAWTESNGITYGLQAEQKVKVTYQGVDLAGRYDWLNINEGWCGAELGDLKTTSSLRWAKTEEELSVHPQPLIYAMCTPAPARVTCRWVYVQTKGAAHVREVKFNPMFSAKENTVTDKNGRKIFPNGRPLTVWDGIVADAKDIVQAWADKGDPNTYEPNLGACDSYGGCPYRSLCKVDSGQRLVMLMGVTPKQGETKNMTTSFDALIAAINPPQATAPRTDAINPPSMTLADETHTKAEMVKAASVMQTVTRTEELPAALDPANCMPTIAPGVEVPAKRKRRTKAEMAAARGPADETTPAQNRPEPEHAVTCKGAEFPPNTPGRELCDCSPKTDPAPAVPQDTAADPSDKPIGTLYVSCQPDHAHENGAYVFNAANWEVSEAAGLSDYRQAEYNKLQGFFVAAVVSKIKTIRPEHLFVDTHWAETNACLATLIAMSGKVVRSL